MNALKHFEKHKQLRWYQNEIKAELVSIGCEFDLYWGEHNVWYREEIVAKLKEITT